MRGELIYTSAPKGLKAGTSGFCTVGVTRGLPRREQQRLESLSGYDFLYGLSDAKAASNPTSYLHTKIDVGGVPHDVLSRVAFAGADHTGRSNKIAHHHLLDPQDRGPHGPAAAIQAIGGAGRFIHAWSGEPTEREAPLLAPILQQAPGAKGAPTWAHVAGDAGWAGALVRAFKESPKTPAILVVRPETDVLALFAESLAILPESERWDVCFTTYYTGSLPPDLPCHWRGAVEGSPAADQARRLAGATVIDLTRPPGTAKEDRYSETARAGRVLSEPVRIVSAPVPTPVPTVKSRKQERASETEADVEPELELVAPDVVAEIQSGRREDSSSSRERRNGSGPALWYFGAAAATLAVGAWALLSSDSAPVPSSSMRTIPRAPTEAVAPRPPAQAQRPLVTERFPSTGDPESSPSLAEPSGTETPSATEVTDYREEPSVPDPPIPAPPPKLPAASPSLSLAATEAEPRTGIASIQTVLPLSPSPGEIAWVVSRAPGSTMTIINRLQSYLAFEPVEGELAVLIRFASPRRKEDLAKLSISLRGDDVTVRRQTVTQDAELLRLLDLIPVELSDGEWSRLLVAAAAPPLRVVEVKHWAKGTVVVDEVRADPSLKLPHVHEVRRPPATRSPDNRSLHEYPAWTVIETSAVGEDSPEERRLVAPKADVWRKDGSPADIVLRAKSPLKELLKEASAGNPNQIADAFARGSHLMGNHRVQWIDAWGVVRAELRVRWTEVP